MASRDAISPPEGDHHKRTKSSVIRTFMHKRTQSKGEGLSPQRPNFSLDIQRHNHEEAVVFQDDTSNPRALGELQNYQNQAPPSPSKKSKEEERPATGKSLHKKTFSTISLKSLAGRDGHKQAKSQEEKSLQPKKTKSTRNLAALLSRPKSSKDLAKMRAEEEAKTAKDKENRTPPNSSPSEPTPPIYAQFSSQTFVMQPSGGKFLEDQIELYTPQQYSPGKQRNFCDAPGSQPTLGRREEARRPLSTSKPQLPHSLSTDEIGSDSREQKALYNQGKAYHHPSKESGSGLKSFAARASEKERNMATQSRPQSFVAKQNNSCSSTSTGHSQESATSTDMDPETVEREFEAMLSRRNIPENQKAKMYNIAFGLKVDLIRQDRAETSGSHDRPGTNSSSESKASEEEADNSEKSSKRPRSRTFTLSRAHKASESISSTKKARPDILGHSRTKSSESIGNTSRSLTSAGAAVASTLMAKAKGQLPDDFVNYLRKVQKPELVEVGKLHKLRLLLRNETVSWTDSFIGLGGMTEIVGLLHRTMEVEWREEHEDALLHEVLLCLKALCTTALALENLSQIQSTLFPALVHMLFDEERKGPSEFTTRNIVTSILFTYLKSAPLIERTQRARTLLSYLRDPQPEEDERPVEFVLGMRRERPFTVWFKEVNNVTKEVFWIFLHGLNVIALPPCAGGNNPSGGSQRNDENSRSTGIRNASTDSLNQHEPYGIRHFPQELPPVAAAPYVGGVEWDATNYLASHLDLLNGILACLPSHSERMSLRQELQISGWERVMGGTLRLCKEKFYGCVHAALRTWVAAAWEDGWDTGDVRCGPVSKEYKSPKKSPNKKKIEEAPKIEMPRLDFALERSPVKDDQDVWI